MSFLTDNYKNSNRAYRGCAGLFGIDQSPRAPPQESDTNPSSLTKETPTGTPTPTPAIDADRDGVARSKEIELGLDPERADSNNDGVNDTLVAELRLSVNQSYNDPAATTLTDLYTYDRKLANSFRDAAFADDGRIVGDANSFVILYATVRAEDREVAHALAETVVADGDISDEERRVVEQTLTVGNGYETKLTNGWAGGDAINQTAMENLALTVKMGLSGEHLNTVAESLTDQDWDDDNYLNQEEMANGTDPFNVDSDGDGLPDGVEGKLIKSDAVDPTQPNHELSSFYQALTTDGRLTPTEAKYLEVVSESRHRNLIPQIQAQGYHEDGNITSRELELSKDPDDDGAISAVEKAVGTPPDDRDVDNDGIPDGWEIFGYKHGDMKGMALSEYNDPLHKDLNVQIEHLNDTRFNEEYIGWLHQYFAAWNVSNPDGTTGISLYTEQVAATNESINSRPGVGSFRYVEVVPESSIALWGRAAGPGYKSKLNASIVKVVNSISGCETPECRNFFSCMKCRVWFVVPHELGHNIFGTLNPSNQASNGDEGHSRYGEHLMHRNQIRGKPHPNTLREIEQDGLLGLRDFKNWDIYYPENAEIPTYQP